MILNKVEFSIKDPAFEYLNYKFNHIRVNLSEELRKKAFQKIVRQINYVIDVDSSHGVNLIQHIEEWGAYGFKISVSEGLLKSIDSLESIEELYRLIFQSLDIISESTRISYMRSTLLKKGSLQKTTCVFRSGSS